MYMRNALLASLVALATTASGGETPASFKSGKIPALSAQSAEVGGGQVLLEVSVSSTGAVSDVKVLRETPAFTQRMVQSVRTWTFTPAESEIPEGRRKPGGPTKEAIDTQVLVAGVFRQPSVIGATLGEPTREVAKNSAAIPFPLSAATPTYPPGTMAPGVVLVEVHVDEKGGVSSAAVRIPSAGFNNAALTT